MNENQKRIAIFIDGSNFYNGSRMVLNKTAVNFHVLGTILLNCLKKKSPEKFLQASFHIYYYNSLIDLRYDPEGYERQNSFLQRLKKTPQLTLRLKELSYKQVEGSKKYYYAEEKGVDLKIAMDMIKMAANHEYDLAILISGNGDFAAMVDFVQSLGKQVFVAFFREILGAALKDQADDAIILTPKLMAGSLLP